MYDAIKIPAQLATKGVDAGIIFTNSIFSPLFVTILSFSEIFSSENGFSLLATTVIPDVIPLFLS